MCGHYLINDMCTSVMLVVCILLSLGSFAFAVWPKVRARIEGARARFGTSKFVLLVLCGTFIVHWAGSKPIYTNGTSRVMMRAIAPKVSNASGLHGNFKSVDHLNGYLVATNTVADTDVFERPDGAVTPEFWTRYGVSDDYQALSNGCVVGISGAITTQPYGMDSPVDLEYGYKALAPLFGTNSFVLGVSDFWYATNDVSRQYVWKDVARNRNPSNLVSFTLAEYDWGDIEMTYRNVSSNELGFVAIEGEWLDIRPSSDDNESVYIERRLTQDDVYWLENYPGLCVTNLEGDLVWTYDTNEWAMVTVFMQATQNVRNGLRKSSASVRTRRVPACVALLDARGRILNAYYDGNTNVVKVLHKFEPGVMYRLVSDKNKIVSVDTGGDFISVRINDYTYEVMRPLALRVTSDKDLQTMTYESFVLTAEISDPSVGGRYEWSSSDNVCVLSPRSKITEVVRNDSNEGYVRCVWKRTGYVPVTNVVSLLGASSSFEDSFASVSLSQSAVFIEGRHLDTNGVAVAGSSTESVLECEVDAETEGSAILDCVAGKAKIEVFENGAQVALPVSVANNNGRRFVVRGIEVSQAKDDVRFELRYTAANSNIEVTRSVCMTVFEVEIASLSDWPAEKKRHVFGPTETINISVCPADMNCIMNFNGKCGINIRDYDFKKTGIYPLSITCGSGYFSDKLKVIAPQNCVSTGNVEIMNTNDWREIGIDPVRVGEVGVGMKSYLKLLPDYVSFKGIETQEGDCEATEISGYFTAMTNISAHNSSNGAFKPYGTDANNFIGHDSAALAFTVLTAPWSDGAFSWDIAVYWKVSDRSDWQMFCNTKQTFHLHSNGDFSVTKYGNTVIRGTNGVSRIIRSD